MPGLKSAHIVFCAFHGFVGEYIGLCVVLSVAEHIKQIACRSYHGTPVGGESGCRHVCGTDVFWCVYGDWLFFLLGLSHDDVVDVDWCRAAELNHGLRRSVGKRYFHVFPFGCCIDIAASDNR